MKFASSSIANSLPSRSSYHPARKLFHFVSGYVFACLTRNLSPLLWRVISFAFFILIFVVEVLRIQKPTGLINKYVVDFFRPFMRSHETSQFTGIAYYVFGVALSSALFSTTAACIGILCLACLDPIAALIGSAFDPYLPEARLRNGKSIAGFVFAATVAVPVVFTAFYYSMWTTMTFNESLHVSILVGLAGALTELIVPSPQLILGWKHFPLGIDDNLFIPLISGAVCEFLLRSRLHDLVLSPYLLWPSPLV